MLIAVMYYGTLHSCQLEMAFVPFSFFTASFRELRKAGDMPTLVRRSSKNPSFNLVSQKNTLGCPDVGSIRVS